MRYELPKTFIDFVPLSTHLYSYQDGTKTKIRFQEIVTGRRFEYYAYDSSYGSENVYDPRDFTFGVEDDVAGVHSMITFYKDQTDVVTCVSVKNNLDNNPNTSFVANYDKYGKLAELVLMTTDKFIMFTFDKSSNKVEHYALLAKLSGGIYQHLPIEGGSSLTTSLDQGYVLQLHEGTVSFLYNDQQILVAPAQINPLDITKLYAENLSEFAQFPTRDFHVCNLSNLNDLDALEAV